MTGPRGALIGLLVAAAMVGCGGRQQHVVVAPVEPASSEQPSPETPPAEEPIATPSAPAAAPADEPVDLLRAAATDLAVSSAYRDKTSQMVNLVDGDLETAWNSRTGDLVGAWIDVRLPEEAKVTSIALTAGFTKQEKQSDLFTGNHRVSKVRVLRAGRELGVFELDTESRALQTLPVKSGGGVYRVEIVEIVPGSKRRWREACVSELRVMGHVPQVAKCERFPRFGLGKLPEPRPRPGTADRADVGKTLRQVTQWFAREWGAVINEEGAINSACMPSDHDDEVLAELQLKRRRVMSEVAKLVGVVDDLQADRLRLAAMSRLPRGQHPTVVVRRGDLDLLAAGFDAVVNWIGDEGARCRWEKANAAMHVYTAWNEVEGENAGCGGSPIQDFEPEQQRECIAVAHFYSRGREIVEQWEENPRSGAARIHRTKLPPAMSKRLRLPWEAMRSRIEVARRACGWVSDR